MLGLLALPSEPVLTKADDKPFEFIAPSDMPPWEVKQRMRELYAREGRTPPTECWVAEVRDGVFPYFGVSTAEPDGWYWTRDGAGTDDDGAMGGPYPTADAAKESAYQAHKGSTLVEIYPTPELAPRPSARRALTQH